MHVHNTAECRQRTALVGARFRQGVASFAIAVGLTLFFSQARPVIAAPQSNEATDGRRLVEQELAKFQGTWQWTDFTIGGTSAFKIFGGHMTWVVEGNKITVTQTVLPPNEGAERKFVWSISIDPSRSPKQIEMTKTEDGKTTKQVLIYEIQGDELRFATHSDPKEKALPKNFTDKKLSVTTFKRIGN